MATRGGARRIDADLWRTWLLGAALSLSALAVWPWAFDSFSAVKLGVITVAAAALAGVEALVAAGRRGHDDLRDLRGPVLVVAALLVLLVLASTVWGRPAESVWGPHGRYSGLLMYLAAGVLFVSAAIAAIRGTIGRLLSVIGITAVLAALYALLQVLGVDPFPWAPVNKPIGTFGNPNFLAAYLGLALPVTVWLALEAPARSRTRWGWLGATAAIAAAALATESVQGPVAGLVGLTAFAALWLFDRRDLPWRRRGLAVLGGAAAAGFGLVVAGLASSGPLADLVGGKTIGFRARFWRAAWAMFVDRPVTGVGFGRFGAFYRVYRTPQAALAERVGVGADDPHNVLLRMLAEGGLPVALAWVTLVVVTAWFLYVGLRDPTGRPRLLLGAVGAAWLAYQVQSLVSIDMPTLVVHHFVLAGLVVGLAVRTRGDVRGTPKRKRVRAPAAWAGWGVVAVVLLIGWWTTRPLRADIALEHAVQTPVDQVAPRIEAFGRAQRTAPWEGIYWQLEGLYLLEDLGRPGEALTRFEEAVDRRPRDLAYVLFAGRASVRAEQLDRAVGWYERAVEIDPHSPDVSVEFARVLVIAGDTERAVTLLEEAVRIEPDEAEWWFQLGLARQAAGTIDGARQALERSLELAPERDDVREALRGL